MGIDIHALNFLRYIAKKRKFGSVATIGRQSLLVSRRELASVLGIPWKDTDFGLFSEELFKTHFGAISVDSRWLNGTHVSFGCLSPSYMEASIRQRLPNRVRLSRISRSMFAGEGYCLLAKALNAFPFRRMR